MEKRVLIAAVLSAALLSLYSQFFLRQQVSKQPWPPSAQLSPHVDLKPAGRPPSIREAEKERHIRISSADLEVEVGARTGQVHRVVLKQYKQAGNSEPLEIGGGHPILDVSTSSGRLTLSELDRTPESLTFDGVDESGNNYNITYILHSREPLLSIKIQKILDVDNQSTNVILMALLSRMEVLDKRSNPLQITALHYRGGKDTYKIFGGPINSERVVPRGTSMLTLSERYFCLSMKTEHGKQIEARVLHSPDQNTIVVEASTPVDPETGTLVFFGPRDYFYMKRAGFEHAFPIGILGQIGLVLLSMLRAVATVTKNYGVAIIVFSIGITCLTAPFTILSFRSMKKMQQLKPKIDKIMAQNKNDTAAANKEIFQLYREHKVNPLGGCLPMLLQMPILIAMYQAISHFIELRGQRFLWIRDLSMPDRLATLPTSLPFLGNELNILPVIMAAVMFFQTKLSQGKLATHDQQNPSTKLMSGPLMPVIFGMMFYHFPAGLVLYWMTNSALSLAWYKLAR